MTIYLKFIKDQKKKTSYVQNSQEDDENIYPDFSSSFEYYEFNSIRKSSETDFDFVLDWENLAVNNIFYILYVKYEFVNPNNSVRTIDLDFAGIFYDFDLAEENKESILFKISAAQNEYLNNPNFDKTHFEKIILKDESKKEFEYHPKWLNHLENEISIHIISYKYEG